MIFNNGKSNITIRYFVLVRKSSTQVSPIFLKLTLKKIRDIMNINTG